MHGEIIYMLKQWLSDIVGDWDVPAPCYKDLGGHPKANIENIRYDQIPSFGLEIQCRLARGTKDIFTDPVLLVQYRTYMLISGIFSTRFSMIFIPWLRRLIRCSWCSTA